MGELSAIIGMLSAMDWNDCPRSIGIPVRNRRNPHFRRVTNGFRSEWGAKVCADLCSVVATGRLVGRTALAVIRDALAAPAPKRTAATSGG